MSLPFIGAFVLDHGLMALMHPSRLTVHTVQPTNYDEAATSVLGSRLKPVVTGPTNDASTYGRKVTVNEILDGWVFADGTAAFWALLDDTNHRLLATASLSIPLAVTERNQFTLTAFDINMPGV